MVILKAGSVDDLEKQLFELINKQVKMLKSFSMLDESEHLYDDCQPYELSA
jgi:hypothetical protein